MEVNHHSLRNGIPRLTSTILSKPQTDTQGSPRHEISNTGSSWVANLENIKTPQTATRQIMDFDRLISLSAVQRVGSVPFLQSRIFQHSIPLTDRQHHNKISSGNQIQKLYSPQRHLQKDHEVDNKYCCNLFERNVIKPSSKAIQPPKRMKRPNLNELIVEKRKIKIVIPQEFNQKRKLNLSEQYNFQTPTNFQKYKSNYAYF